MTRSELIALLAARHPNLQVEDVSVAVKLILSAMTNALSSGHRIEVRGFGSFSTSMRGARTGRNPKTGEQVTIPAKSTITFKPGLELRDRVNAAAANGHAPADLAQRMADHMALLANASERALWRDNPLSAMNRVMNPSVPPSLPSKASLKSE